MKQRLSDPPNIVLLRGAALWLLMALLLAWCLVGLILGVPFLRAIFAGEQSRVLQAHIDFLLMTALSLAFLRGKGSATLDYSMGDGHRRLYELEPVSAGGHISSAGFARTHGGAVPDGLPDLCDEQLFINNVWVWRGADHRPLVNISRRVLRSCHREVTFRISDNLQRLILSLGQGHLSDELLITPAAYLACGVQTTASFKT